MGEVNVEIKYQLNLNQSAHYDCFKNEDSHSDENLILAPIALPTAGLIVTCSS